MEIIWEQACAKNSEALVSPWVIREFLDCAPSEGLLTWRHRGREWFCSDKGWKVWNGKNAGNPALITAKDGYMVGAVFRRNLRAHRVIWCWVHGAWPDGQVDHINGDRSDNRMQNLRVVEHKHNQRNMKLARNNTSGVTGVRLRPELGKWDARIKVDQKVHLLGLFDCMEDARRARKAAEKAHGFHPNHGRRDMGSRRAG